MPNPILLLVGLLTICQGCSFGSKDCFVSRSRSKSKKQLCNFKYSEESSSHDSVTDVVVTSPSLLWASSVPTDGSLFSCDGIVDYAITPPSNVRLMLTREVTENLESLQCSIAGTTLTIHALVDGTLSLYSNTYVSFQVNQAALSLNCPPDTAFMIKHKK